MRDPGFASGVMILDRRTPLQTNDAATGPGAGDGVVGNR